MRENHHLTEDQDYFRARELRHNSSSFEQKLWAALRQIAKIEQLKFRRQQPIHPYIVDFACMKAKLLIELDGDSHDNQQAQTYDQVRDAYLKEQGYTILRFGNDEIKDNLPNVINAIVKQAKSLLLPLNQHDASSPLEGEDSFS